MSTPYLAQITIFSFNFPPKGWAFCNGQILPINQYQALFSLLGTTYGGNGVQTFALPNLQASAVMSFGNGYNQGQSGGEAAHTLITAEIPSHVHAVAAASSPGNVAAAPGSFPAVVASDAYAAGEATTQLGTGMANAGGSQPHENRQPYLVVSFCIALEGIFPSRS